MPESKPHSRAPRPKAAKKSNAAEADADTRTQPLRYEARRSPRRSQPPLPRPDNDNPDPLPPTTPMAAALRRPQQPLLPAVADPRTLPGSNITVVPLRPRIGGITGQFLREELPLMNIAVKRGEVSTAFVANVIRSRLSKSDLDGLARVAALLRTEDAIYVLGALGAIASSIVHHVRVESGDRESSDGLRLIPGLETALLAFGRATGLPPRDQAYTSWLLNGPWTFTGTEGERRFGLAVREAERLLGLAVTLIADVRARRVPLVDAVERLEAAAALVAEYRQIQSDLQIHAFPKEFLEFRDYLPPFVIGGRRVEGPNATFTLAWTDLDVAVGLLGRAFHPVVRKRARYMPPWDRHEIGLSLVQPSLCGLVADAVGVDRGHLVLMSQRNLQRRLCRSPAKLGRAILAVSGLAWEVAKLAAVHWGVIVKNLKTPVEQMTPEERGRLVTPPTGGVGGNHLQKTIDLMRRRLDHPLALLGKAGGK